MLPASALAISVEDVGSSIGLGTADLVTVATNVLRWALGLLGIVAVLMVLLGGLQWMVAGGNEDAVTRARRTIGNAIIGMILVLLAWAIVRFVLQTGSVVTETPP